MCAEGWALWALWAVAMCVLQGTSVGMSNEVTPMASPSKFDPGWSVSQQGSLYSQLGIGRREDPPPTGGTAATTTTATTTVTSMQGNLRTLIAQKEKVRRPETVQRARLAPPGPRCWCWWRLQKRRRYHATGKACWYPATLPASALTSTTPGVGLLREVAEDGAVWNGTWARLTGADSDEPGAHRCHRDETT